MSDADGDALERRVGLDEHDVDARVRLAGFYFLRRQPENHRRRAEHLAWLAEHRPDIGLGGFGYIEEDLAPEGHEATPTTPRAAHSNAHAVVMPEPVRVADLPAELLLRKMPGMEWPIRSYESVGPIHFGMSIRNARAALAEPLLAHGKGWAVTKSFLKDPRRDDLPTDDFFDVGLHLYYRIDGHRLVVDAAEIFPPAMPTLDGFPLLGQGYGAVRDFLRRIDPAAEVAIDGAKSSKLGVSLYDGSCGEEPDERPGSAFVCSRGYWERPIAPLAKGGAE